LTALNEINTALRRLTVLRVLSESPELRANTTILQAACGQLGVGSSRADIQAACDWLHGQGLITAERVGPVLVATLTQAGADVASGAAAVDGVARPSPRY
jgi:hypothetical protein